MCHIVNTSRPPEDTYEPSDVADIAPGAADCVRVNAHEFGGP